MALYLSDRVSATARNSYKQVVAGDNVTITEDSTTATISASGGPGGEAFPVGSVFLAVVDTDPATLLGYGTWGQIAQGQFLVGLDSGDTDFDTVEETGGAKTHTHAGHDNHVFTQPSDHAATPTSQVTGSRKGGTSGAATLTDTHTHNTPVLSHTGGAVDAHSAHDSPSHLPPYFTIYCWKRTA